MPAISTILLTALSLSATIRSLELIAYCEPGCRGGKGCRGSKGGEAGGEGDDGGDGGDGGDGTPTPPPQAQHMVFEEKSVSS